MAQRAPRVPPPRRAKSTTQSTTWILTTRPVRFPRPTVRLKGVFQLPTPLPHGHKQKVAQQSRLEKPPRRLADPLQSFLPCCMAGFPVEYLPPALSAAGGMGEGWRKANSSGKSPLTQATFGQRPARWIAAGAHLPAAWIPRGSHTAQVLLCMLSPSVLVGPCACTTTGRRAMLCMPRLCTGMLVATPSQVPRRAFYPQNKRDV